MELKKLKSLKRHLDKMIQWFEEDESVIYHIKELRIVIWEKIMDEEMKEKTPID